MESLNNKYHIVKLYFPSFDKEGYPLESLLSNKIYQNIKEDISRLSGGLTVYPAQGIYLNQAGKLIQEDISVLSIYTDNLNSMLDLIRYQAGIILESLNQESVLIEYDNNPEFIRNKDYQEG